MKYIDQCANCNIENTQEYYDFSCTDCPCYTCADLHHCNGQCGEKENRRMNETQTAIYMLLLMAGREDEAEAYREKCEAQGEDNA